MNKLYVLLIFIISMIIILPGNVFAEDNVRLSLSCNSTRDQTNNISCDLMANTYGKTVKSISFRYSIDNSIKFSKFDTNVGSAKTNSTTISIDNADFSGNNVKVGTIYFKSVSGSSGNKNIRLLDIYYYVDNARYNHSQISDSVYISLSTTREITSINLSSGILSPSFSSNRYNYTVDNYKEDNITISANHNGSQITGTGNHKLDLGENTIKLVVTAQNGNTRTYKIVVNRVDTRNSDTKVANILINDTPIEFDANNREYNINITSSKAKISVEKNIATQKIEYNPGNTIELELDEVKDVIINVTSESGATDKYTLHIKRIASDDPTLNFKTFKINGEDFLLDAENNVYNISVANSVTELNLEYELEDSASEVTIEGNENFKVGTNEVVITVKNQNDEEKKYVFWVDRKEDVEVLENNLEQILLELDGNKNKISVSINEKDDNKLIYKDVLNKLCKTDKQLSYDILNKNDGIIYSIILDNIKCGEEAFEKDIDITLDITDTNGDIKKLVKKKNFLYIKENEIELPSGSKIKLFVGDLFKDGTNIYIYEYDKTKLVTLQKKLKVKNGFITFDARELSNIVVTDYNKDAVENVIDPTNKTDSKPNKLFVSISLIVEFAVIIGLVIYIIINNIKMKKIDLDI